MSSKSIFARIFCFPEKFDIKFGKLEMEKTCKFPENGKWKTEKFKSTQKRTYMIDGYQFPYHDSFIMLQSGQYAAQVSFEKDQKIIFVFKTFFSVIKI